MHAAWAGTGSGIGTRGGTGANFSHPYMDEMWDGWSAALHHNPWITRRPGGFETPGVHPTLILNKPPSFVGEHAFEIHHCPQAVGALIMGRLQDPVIVGGARMWTNHVAPLASFPINRNGYNVATVVVPDMSIPILGGTSLPSLVIQAVWTGAAPEMASDAFIWQINPLVPTGA
jgi:hypothetical protein